MPAGRTHAEAKQGNSDATTINDQKANAYFAGEALVNVYKQTIYLLTCSGVQRCATVRRGVNKMAMRITLSMF
jgi:hypothetical protein